MPLTPVNHPLGTPFVELQSIDSTNNYALGQIHANVAEAGACYFAHQQTGGKGQRGKSWISEKDLNITLSIVLKPSFLQPFQQFYLSACVAVATHHFVSSYARDHLTIKWPNDLYWADRKLGGILIENVISGIADDTVYKSDNEQKATNSELTSADYGSSWKWSVVGIGINVNQIKFPDELKNAVSLKQITSKDFNTVYLAKGLCKTIDHFYKRLQVEKLSLHLDLYNRFLYKKNKLVHFRRGNQNFYATIKSVNENGQLIIQHSIEEEIDFGQVEWIVETSGMNEK